MRDELPPNWSDDDRTAGERLHQAWDRFFSAAQKAEDTPQQPLPGAAEELRIAQTLARWEADLLRYPNVVGVSEGIRTRQGKPTAERCLVVYVERKVAKDQLPPNAVLPTEIDGIPIDVVEVGKVEALPR